MAARRDYPASFFWGIVIVLLSPSAVVDSVNPASLLGMLAIAAVGAFLVWRGWKISEVRPRRG